GAAAQELRQADEKCVAQREIVQAQVQQLQAVEARLAELHAQHERDKDDHVEAMRQAARLQNDVVSFKAQLENLTRERERLRHRSEQAAESLATLDVELQELKAADDSLHGRTAAARQVLADTRQQREQHNEQAEQVGQRVNELRTERSAVGSRI